MTYDRGRVPLVSSTNKTDRHDKTDILLKVLSSSLYIIFRFVTRSPSSEWVLNCEVKYLLNIFWSYLSQWLLKDINTLLKDIEAQIAKYVLEMEVYLSTDLSCPVVSYNDLLRCPTFEW